MSLNLPRFAALALAACLMASATHAAEQSHTLLIEDISVHRLESGLEVNVAYQVPISLCKAFAFLTHYEGATDMPGVLESRVLSREGNKVQVRRLVEERILFFPLKIHSVVEYSEFPNHGLDPKEHHLWLSNPQTLYGFESADLAPGFKRTKGQA